MLPAPFRSGPRSALAPLALALLAACSDGAAPGGAPADAPAPIFSEEERIAARALSIGNRGAVAEANSPRDEALACSRAIGALAERFRQRGGLSGEQLATLERAQGVYDQRAETLGASVAPGETGDGQEPEDENAASESALLAVGCIQKLAEAG